MFAIFAGGSSAAPGSFSGQNGLISFDAVSRSDGPQGSVQIFQVSATGSGLKQLTSPTRPWNQDPAYSASGAKIYFTSDDRATTNPGGYIR